MWGHAGKTLRRQRSSAPVWRGRIGHWVEAKLQPHSACDAHLATPHPPYFAACCAAPAYASCQPRGLGRLCRGVCCDGTARAWKSRQCTMDVPPSPQCKLHLNSEPPLVRTLLGPKRVEMCARGSINPGSHPCDIYRTEHFPKGEHLSLEKMQYCSNEDWANFASVAPNEDVAYDG